METVAGSLQWAELALAQLGPEWLESCKVDSQWLLEHVLQRNSAWLRTWPEHELSDEQWQQYQQLVERRMAGEPVAYLTGVQGFWTLELMVTADTLVPRPDTELLVEQVLALSDSTTLDKAVLDMGTGTGAIALALASERPRWSITATDIHTATLDVARRNSETLNLPLRLIESAWFGQLTGERFHIIVSNPPYIEERDEHLQGIGVRFEPQRALASGSDGLDAIREIIANAPAHLYEDGWLLLEHGYNQGVVVRALLQARGFTEVRTVQDMGDNDRVTLGQWTNTAQESNDDVNG